MYETYLTKSLTGLVNATQALEAYEKTNIKDLKNSAAYNVQQAIEYLLKYLIYNHSGYTQESSEEKITQIYSHNLNLLILQHCDTLGIPVPFAIRDKAILYTSWEAESRYSLGFSVRADAIKNAIRNTSSWLVEIAPKYQKKIKQINKRLNIQL
ncbi:MAG: hypothetical protein J6J44_03180 [Lachnospiraceae bacterium]|nr:hypothetical protein [Lachnospiraceae bacterium]